MTDTASLPEDPEFQNQGLMLQRLPFTFAKRHGVVLTWEQEQPVLYFRSVPSADIFSEVTRITCQSPLYRKVGTDKLSEVLSECYHNDSSEALQNAAGISDDLDLGSLADAVPVTEDLLEQSDDAPVIRLINALLTEAIKEGASDVHIETFESNLVVRVRVDGVLREILSLQRTLAALLVSRIKVMARLDIAEKRILRMVVSP